MLRLIAALTIYLPLMFGPDGVVVSIDGHGERVAVQHDFAVVTCVNGATPSAAITNDVVVVRCEQ